VSWHYSIEALAVLVAPALSTRSKPNAVRVVESSSSSDPPSSRPGDDVESSYRHELIQLPTIIKVRLLGTRPGRQSGTVPGTVPDLAGDGDAPPGPGVPVPVPDLSGIGDSPPSPCPIWRGRGRSPVPDIGGSAPWFGRALLKRRVARKTGRVVVGTSLIPGVVLLQTWPSAPRARGGARSAPLPVGSPEALSAALSGSFTSSSRNAATKFPLAVAAAALRVEVDHDVPLAVAWNQKP
jgi:hypothetical protein